MSSDIRRREAVTQPYYAAIEAVADPNTRRVLRDIYDHLPLDYVTFDDLPDVTQVVRETVVVPQFVDRGDPAEPDWTQADLTCDENWHVLDLTTVNAAIAGATEVQFRIVFSGSYGDVRLRRHGAVNGINVERQIFESGDPQSGFTLHVAPDENGRIDYWASSGARFALTVSGWWTGYGSEGTGASSEIALNSAHRLGDGSDHSQVAANSAHRLGDGSDHADVAANTAHRTGDGTDHSAIATGHPHQDVTATASPTFGGLTLTGASGVLVASAGVVGSGATTSDLPEGANLYFTEDRANAASNVVAAYNHITSDGSSHSHIATNHPHQDVGTTAAPSFAGLSVSSASEPIANFIGAYDTTIHRLYVTNKLAAASENRAAIAFRCNSSTQMRFAAEIAAGLSTVTDASRVGQLELRTADAGAAPATRLAIRGSQIGFFGATPVSQDTGWSVTNVTTDRSYNADATTLDEIADVLGTLINYLKSLGLLGG